MRAGFGGPYALDFGAVIELGRAVEADLSLLADVLPSVEQALLDAIHNEGEGGDD